MGSQQSTPTKTLRKRPDPKQGRGRPNDGHAKLRRAGSRAGASDGNRMSMAGASSHSARGRVLQKQDKSRGRMNQATTCVVCKSRQVHLDFLTCGLDCVERLWKDGGDPAMCNYCHRKPKGPNRKQCSDTCAENAKVACLLCRCRPKNGEIHHFCGKTCKSIAMKSSPMILEIPVGHKTHEMVKGKFKSAWNNVTGPMPPIKKVYKIVENDEFLAPFTTYKQRVGNEQFRYHGTKRQCQLGVTSANPCASATCAVCNILKRSFQVSLAKKGGAFGPGVYCSSASNKAFSYCGATGSMLVTRVVLGKICTVKDWNEVMSCPAGFDSVVFDRHSGQLNETIVYTDDAIRPDFLITF